MIETQPKVCDASMGITQNNLTNISTVTSNMYISTDVTANYISNVNVCYSIEGGIELGVPRTEGGRIVVLSLSGIHKVLPRVNGTITCITPVTHSLGLLLIEGVTRIKIDNGGTIDKIINKYVGTRDILSAQDELLDAGYKEHARL